VIHVGSLAVTSRMSRINRRLDSAFVEHRRSGFTPPSMRDADRRVTLASTCNSSQGGHRVKYDGLTPIPCRRHLMKWTLRFSTLLCILTLTGCGHAGAGFRSRLADAYGGVLLTILAAAPFALLLATPASASSSPRSEPWPSCSTSEPPLGIPPASPRATNNKIKIYFYNG